MKKMLLTLIALVSVVRDGWGASNGEEVTIILKSNQAITSIKEEVLDKLNQVEPVFKVASLNVTGCYNETDKAWCYEIRGSISDAKAKQDLCRQIKALSEHYKECTLIELDVSWSDFMLTHKKTTAAFIFGAFILEWATLAKMYLADNEKTISEFDVKEFRQWLVENKIKTLMVSGLTALELGWLVWLYNQNEVPVGAVNTTV